ncbi:MAG: integrase/recombinase XerD, partial [Glaciecola sp.]
LKINKSKGLKDRYTVLSNKVLVELRHYYQANRPKTYLFNGQKKVINTEDNDRFIAI